MAFSVSEHSRKFSQPPFSGSFLYYYFVLVQYLITGKNYSLCSLPIRRRAHPTVATRERCKDNDNFRWREYDMLEMPWVHLFFCRSITCRVTCHVMFHYSCSKVICQLKKNRNYLTVKIPAAQTQRKMTLLLASVENFRNSMFRRSHSLNQYCCKPLTSTLDPIFLTNPFNTLLSQGAL